MLFQGISLSGPVHITAQEQCLHEFHFRNIWIDYAIHIFCLVFATRSGVSKWLSWHWSCFSSHALFQVPPPTGCTSPVTPMDVGRERVIGERPTVLSGCETPQERSEPCGTKRTSLPPPHASVFTDPPCSLTVHSHENEPSFSIAALSISLKNVSSPPAPSMWTAPRTSPP